MEIKTEIGDNIKIGQKIRAQKQAFLCQILTVALQVLSVNDISNFAIFFFKIEIYSLIVTYDAGGVTFTKIVRGCACLISKI